jgi:ACS family glucarate transporter-like MFS transporter
MSPEKPTNVRWWLVGMLTAFAFVSYLQRINISVAAELMETDLHLSKTQLGQIFSSFLIGYGIFQIPGGLLADRYGTRITLATSAALWGICTIATGLVPALPAAGATFASLWMARLLLGSAEATTYPVGALAVHNWIVPSERAFANSCMFAGTSLAAAFATPFVSWLMLRVGWRNVFLITSLPAFAAALAWWLFSADTPALHRGINPAERALANSEARKPQAAFNFVDLLRNPRIVLLCMSYVAEGYLLFLYVFWLYIYLVEVRGFTMMRGGLVASLPWLTGLALTPFGGLAADRIALSRGRLPAAKYIVMAGYSLSGALLFLAAFAPNKWVCVAALSLSVGFLMASEASFWVSATYLAGANAGAVSGLMNTAGILGGIASTSLIPLLVARFSWAVAFASGTLVALSCVLLWIWVAKPPDHRLGQPFQELPNLLDMQQEQS